MDEIFSAGNLLANCIWQKKYTRANDASYFSDNHDHILAYARTKAAFRIGRTQRAKHKTRHTRTQTSIRWAPGKQRRYMQKAAQTALHIGSEMECFGSLQKEPIGAFQMKAWRACGRFYPDFLCVLPGGKVLAVEYKGAQGWTDAADDRAIGDVWAELSQGRCAFVMVRDRNWAAIDAVLG